MEFGRRINLLCVRGDGDDDGDAIYVVVVSMIYSNSAHFDKHNAGALEATITNDLFRNVSFEYVEINMKLFFQVI